MNDSGGRSTSTADSNGLLLLLSYAFFSVFGAMGSIFIVSALTVVSSLQNRGNAYLASLSLGHLLISVLVLPSSCIAIMAGISGNNVTLCQGQWLTTLAAITVHSLSSLLIAGDSCLGLTDHPRYTHRCTRLRVLVLILAVWSVAIFVVTINYSNQWSHEVCSLFTQTIANNASSSVSLTPHSPSSGVASTSAASSSSSSSSSTSVSGSQGRATLVPAHQSSKGGRKSSAPSSSSVFMTSSSSSSSSSTASPSISNSMSISKSASLPPRQLGPIDHARPLSPESLIWMQWSAVILLLTLIVTIIFFVRSFLQMRRLKERNSISYAITDENLLRSHAVVYAFNVALSTPLVVSLVIPLRPEVIRTAWWLAIANSSTFSFVYALTNRELGDTFAQLFTYCCCKSHVNWVRKTTGGPMAPRGSTLANQITAPTLQTHTMINVRPHQPYGMATLHGNTSTSAHTTGPFRHFRGGNRFTSDL